MAIKHVKAKRECAKEALNRQNDFAQTSWGLSKSAKKCMAAIPRCYFSSCRAL